DEWFPEVSWFENNFQRFASGQGGKAFFELFQRQLARYKAAVQHFFSQSRREDIAHHFPGFKNPASDHAANRQASKDDVAGKVHFDLTFRNAQQDEGSSH